jgi:hypothetical protein
LVLVDTESDLCFDFLLINIYHRLILLYNNKSLIFHYNRGKSWGYLLFSPLLMPGCPDIVRAKPKTIKLVFVLVSPLSRQHYKEKDWLARNQDNVSEWGDMSIHKLLFQWASTMKKNPTKSVSLVQSRPHHHLIEN